MSRRPEGRRVRFPYCEDSGMRPAPPLPAVTGSWSIETVDGTEEAADGIRVHFSSGLVATLPPGRPNYKVDQYLFSISLQERLPIGLLLDDTFCIEQVGTVRCLDIL